MTRMIVVLTAVLCTACASTAGGGSGAVAEPAVPESHTNDMDRARASLKPFDSMQELRHAIAAVAEARRVEDEKKQAAWREQCLATAKSEPALQQSCSAGVTETVTVSGAGPVESITNVQHQGVDEGGIVKRHGDMLIVLRRGRLFTIGIGGGQLDSLAVADAFGRGIESEDGGHTWYDELLVWERTAVVIGFSYERGGTEIGLFELGPAGDLSHRATYHLRSNDYYSAGNYASRLIGERLVLFSTLWIPRDGDPEAWLPAMRRWDDRGPHGAFDSITPISRVFRPVTPLDAHVVIHTMVTCNLAAPSFTCEATVVVGDSLTVYYASPHAAYAWTTAWTRDGPSRSVLYRMPFDGRPVTAIGVTGLPSHQLAFFEDWQDHLNVVVARPDDVAALLRLPLSSFSDGTVDAPASQYRPLARGLGQWLITRFVGPYVLVGAPNWEGNKRAVRKVVVARWDGDSIFRLSLAHDVQRIEGMGAHAVVMGTEKENTSLRITAIRLDIRPGVAGTLWQQDAYQAEGRSHAFFYREDSPDDGLFGLPIVTTTRDDIDDFRGGSARVLFVRNRALAFAPVGTLDAAAGTRIDDGCVVSCYDWYGNARPIFIDDRIFALLGYEIVEGRLVGGRVEKVRRLDFTPRQARRPE